MNSYSISARALAEFLFASGDLDLRFQGTSKMMEGMKVHQRIQASQGEDYRAEVSFRKVYILDGMELVLTGRADGVLSGSEGYTIDEIKGTSGFIDKITEETYPAHWAQAKIYGALLCEELDLEHIAIQLTYVEFESGMIKRLKQPYTASEMASFLEAVIERYKRWLFFKDDWRRTRDSGIVEMAFPFEGYRPGQRELAVAVYKAIEQGKCLYAEAPTGIGKTLSTLFPAIKRMGEGRVSRLFYLSAKGTGKRVAQEALVQITAPPNPPHLKHIVLTAKEKLCLNDHVACYGDACPYAKGYYDRHLEALWEAITSENAFGRETLIAYAERFKVCPYEFSLSVALFCDVVIGDYNYAFDPRVYLRRFFDAPSEPYVLLVDEAHNLVDRARGMYSAVLEKRRFHALRRALEKASFPQDKALIGALSGLNRLFLDVRKMADESGVFVDEAFPEALLDGVRKRMPAFEAWLSAAPSQGSPDARRDASEGAPGRRQYDDVLEAFFQLTSFVRIAELYDNGFLFYIEGAQTSETVFKLMNIDPSIPLARFIEPAQTTVFFSATLSPESYYRHLFTGRASAMRLSLSSPFDADRCLALCATDVSTRYKSRSASIEPLAAYIHHMAAAHSGNYLVFFPSYAYMEQVHSVFSLQFDGEYDIIKQERHFTESDRDAFLERFSERSRERAFIAFAVMGSHFSEGIDLKGERLIGTLIVGVGLPMIDFENQLIMQYFDAREGRGFDFAYRYPGINKILQSAGRVIRDERDRGVILLVDDRYRQSVYQRLLPEHLRGQWTTQGTVKAQLRTFWEAYNEG